MKRINPNFIVRIFKGWKAGITALFGLSSIFGLLLFLFNFSQYCWYRNYYSIIIILIISILAAFISGNIRMLPSIIIDELSKENSYIASYCDSSGLKEADEMTKPYFGNDFIPFNQIEQWRLKNPKGFVQIKNSEGLLCACFVILGLASSFFDQFLVGSLSEHDIRSDDVLDIESSKKLDRIYISGVVVRNPSSFLGHKRANIMLWTMLQYINKMYGFRKNRAYYAVAITNESEKLLKALNFNLLGDKHTRKDQSNLYKIDINRETWNNLLCRIGDYSRMVRLLID